MKTIIRIEHEDGNGMFRKKIERFAVGDYTDNILLNNLWERHDACNKGGMPVPYNDGIDLWKNRKEWFLGFKSMEQFNQWCLPEEVKELLKLGFKVLMIDVEEYQEGGCQIAFTKDTILQQKDISSLFV